MNRRSGSGQGARRLDFGRRCGLGDLQRVVWGESDSVWGTDPLHVWGCTGGDGVESRRAQVVVELKRLRLEDDVLLVGEAVFGGGMGELMEVVEDPVDDSGIGQQGHKHHGAAALGASRHVDFEHTSK